AMGETVKKGGFGTSVTPVSQFYFQQAFNNVMFGEWKKIAEGYGKMVLGYFGKTPVEPDATVVKIAQEQLKLDPTTENPLDINDRNTKKGVAACKKMLEEAGLATTDENIFIVASCAEKGILYLQGKATLGIKKNEPVAEKKEEKKDAPNGYVVNINGKDYAVKLNGNTANVNGTNYNITVKDGVAASAQPVATGDGKPVTSPMPGLVLRITAKVGDVVKEGQNILVMESMKMETSINAPSAGTIVSINVNQGQQVKSGTVLATIK
ncbi:MAG TPA: biotin/lipoyl-binding protein, partial [Spirochaetota bacterium]|nr:biotin/lipoyl-binding protein [Spirochaetota bacterium]